MPAIVLLFVVVKLKKHGLITSLIATSISNNTRLCFPDHCLAGKTKWRGKVAALIHMINHSIKYSGTSIIRTNVGGGVFG